MFSMLIYVDMSSLLSSEHKHGLYGISDNRGIETDKGREIFSLLLPRLKNVSKGEKIGIYHTTDSSKKRSPWNTYTSSLLPGVRDHTYA